MAYSTTKMVVLVTLLIVVPWWLALFATLFFGLSWYIPFSLYAVLVGFGCRELAFCGLGRYLDGNTERDSYWPAFRRLDMHNWKKSKLFYGAFIFFFRGPLAITLMVIIAVIAKFCLIGWRIGEKPMTGLRLKVI
jgi:hypothetical protein